MPCLDKKGQKQKFVAADNLFAAAVTAAAATTATFAAAAFEATAAARGRCSWSSSKLEALRRQAKTTLEIRSCQMSRSTSL